MLHYMLPTPPFLHIQSDLAGPYTVKCDYHPRKLVKVWVLVSAFQSLVGAVSLISIPGYSSEDVFHGLTLLSNRYGRFRSIVSDAGPNMIKAIQLYNSRSEGQSADHIQVPPRAQHRNGKAERSVGLFKRLLPPKTVDQKPCSASDFSLLLSSIENQLNSRPIGMVKGQTSLDSSSLITPNQVLQIGRTLDPDQTYKDGNPVVLQEHLRPLLARTLEKVSSVTIPLAVRSKKWRDEAVPLQPGTFVAFRQANPLAKNPWQKGVIIDSLISHSDKRVRTYLVRTLQDKKIFVKTLPVDKLVDLEEFDNV